MGKAIQYIIKATLFIFIISFSSCTKEVTIYCDNTNKEWLTTYKVGDNFIMIDDNNISHSFVMNNNYSDFNESGVEYFSIINRKTYIEQFYQEFTSIYGVPFSIYLTACWEPYGDEISIQLDEIVFKYDLKLQTISHIESPFGYLSKTMTDKGYDDHITINSTVEILDSYIVNEVEYSDVLHFTFNDFKRKWGQYTVKEIFIAKKYGLIKYILNNDLTFQRK